VRETIDARLTGFAERYADKPAIVCIDAKVTKAGISWGDLHRITLQQAEKLRTHLPHRNTVVLVSADNSLANLISIVAVLRSGFLVAPLNPNMPDAQRDTVTRLVEERIGPTIRVEEVISGGPGNKGLLGPLDKDAGGVVLLTGGSTGASRLVMKGGMPAYDTVAGAPLHLRYSGWKSGQTQMLFGPTYHTAPLTHLIDAMLSGNTLIVPSTTIPHLIFDFIEEYSIGWIQLTPSHMSILAPYLATNRDRLQSINGVLHTAAPCPPAVKRVWIKALGAKRIFEMYAATEGLGATLCRGDEWLKRPGTVGRGFMTMVQIRSEGGQRLPPGGIGTVYMKSAVSKATIFDQSLRRCGDGFSTVGDRGYLDESEYLFLVGRQDDLIIVGGENVYAASVATKLMDHPSVFDAAVIGEDDKVLGSRLVAIVATGQVPPTNSDLIEYCRLTMSPHEVPSRFVLVDKLPRTNSGKLPYESLRRLVDTRSIPGTGPSQLTPLLLAPQLRHREYDRRIPL
jgi:bile acid-coenzyme A ligase